MSAKSERQDEPGPIAGLPEGWSARWWYGGASGLPTLELSRAGKIVAAGRVVAPETPRDMALRWISEDWT